MPRRPAVSAGTQPLRRGRHSAEPSAAFRRTTLPGGLRVVTEYLPAVHSASVGVWVGVGSRDEGVTVAGAAHFLEHLLFKSTPTRTAVDIAQAVDAVGGELNAFTADSTAIWSWPSTW
jgi:predicted Zn-dependent peptidase